MILDFNSSVVNTSHDNNRYGELQKLARHFAMISRYSQIVLPLLKSSDPLPIIMQFIPSYTENIVINELVRVYSPFNI